MPRYIKVLFLLFPVLCFSYTGIAQLLFQGSVSDKEEALPFAAIAIFRLPDSAFVTSGHADSSGQFVLYLPLPDTVKQYALISMAGFDPEKIVVEKDHPPYHIILKAAGNTLEDVTILSRKKLIERKADRTVFNAENSISSIGSDAFEVLKKAPGVQVSNNVVGIAGKSSVSVMINDRLVQVSGSELESLLRSIPASNVSRIEVITAPPAKYDAEGNSGILNIVTKKSMKNGFNGNVTLTYEQRTQGSEKLQGSFNYRNGNLNVYGTTNINRFIFISEQQTHTEYTTQRQLQVLNQDNRPLYTWSQLGADYQLTPNAVLGFVYTLGTMDTRRNEHIRTQSVSLPAMALDSSMNTDAFATDRGRRNVFNLNYDWKIDSSGKKLSLNTDYFTRKGNNTRDFTTGNLYADGTGTGSYSDNRTRGKLNTDIGTVRADLDYPLSFAIFSIGAKTSWIHNYSDNIFSYRSGNDYVNDAGKTNTFDYKENTQALYVSVKKDWGKWNAQAGLRAENTNTRGESVTLNQVNTNSYFKFFPSAYLQYKPNDNHSWNINYTRRINRPSFWNMNPFRVYSTATAYEEGNPFLQPSFSNNIELGYALQTVLAFTAYIQKVDASAMRVSVIDMAHHSFYFSQANAGNSLEYGISATVNVSPVSWWENTTACFGSYKKFSSSFYKEEVSYARPSFSIETSNTFILNKNQTLLAELNFEYNSRQQDDFDIQYSTSNLSIGCKALFFQKRLIAAINVEDLLRTDIWQVRNEYNGTYQRSYWDSRIVSLSLGWKFGNQFIKEKRQRNTNSEEARRAN